MRPHMRRLQHHTDAIPVSAALDLVYVVASETFWPQKIENSNLKTLKNT